MNKLPIRPGFLAFLSLVLAWGLVLPSHAQTRDSLLRVYNTKSIYAFGSKYIKGDRQIPFRKIKTEFTSAGTLDLYKGAKKDLFIARAMTVTAVAALVGSAVLRKDARAGGIALLVVGIGLNLGSLHFRNEYSELIDKALWQHNKEILFNAPQ